MAEQQLMSPKKGPILIAYATLGTVLLVFGAIVAIVSLQVRSDLRERVVQQHADIWTPITHFHVEQGMADEFMAGLEIDEIIMYSLLATAEIDGALGVQIYDSDGYFLSGIPVEDRNLEAPRLDTLRSNLSLGRLLESKNPEGESEQSLEVLVPLVDDETDELLAVARYLFESAMVVEEFASIDSKLAKQAVWAFASGGVLVSIVFILSYFRLRRAHTEVEERAQRLAQANAELAMVAKTSAVGAVASHLIHGLKNPLAGLRQHIATGGEGLESEDWFDANEAAKRMQSMINEVVDVLRNDESSEFDTISVDDIADALEGKFSGEAQDHGLFFQARMRGTCELSAKVANIAKLIVSNLLQNAIDATPSGGDVELRVELKSGQLMMSVLDTGPGFTDTAKANLFSPCQSSKATGAGIGLAISRQLARHIGAGLELVKTSTAGSVMLLSVPLSAD